MSKAPVRARAESCSAMVNVAGTWKCRVSNHTTKPKNTGLLRGCDKKVLLFAEGELRSRMVMAASKTTPPAFSGSLCFAAGSTLNF